MPQPERENVGPGRYNAIEVDGHKAVRLVDLGNSCELHCSCGAQALFTNMTATGVRCPNSFPFVIDSENPGCKTP